MTDGSPPPSQGPIGPPARLDLYPSLIASACEDLERSFDHRGFRGVMRAFAASLKLVGLLPLAEYIVRCDRVGGDPAVDRFLASGGPFFKPSLGHFVQLLQRLLRNGLTWLPQSSVAPLEGLLDSGRRFSPPFWKHVEALLRTRNIYLHSNVEIPPEKTALVLAEARQNLWAMLADLDWLADGQLLWFDRDGGAWTCRRQIEPTDAGDGDRRNEIVWRHGGRQVALPPLLIDELTGGLAPGPGAAAPSVLHYETVQGRRIKYLRGPHHHYADDPSLRQRFESIRRRASGRDEQTRGSAEPAADTGSEPPRWDHMTEAATAWTQRIIDLQIARRKYREELYAPRPAVEERIDRFIAEDRRLMVVVGDSGCGKTNLLCHTSHTLQRDSHAVLHLYGREYEGEAVPALVARGLGWAHEQAERRLALCADLPEVARGRRLVILFDAINEHPEPEALFGAILHWLEEGDAPACVRVVVTCRPLAWSRIEVGFQLDPRLAWHEPGPTGAPRGCVALDRFTQDELSDAWSRRTEGLAGGPDRAEPDPDLWELLRDPLLLHLYWMYAYGEGATGRERPPGSAEELLRLRLSMLQPVVRDRVQAVVRRMWLQGTDALDSAAYTRDPEIETWATATTDPVDFGVYACREPSHRRDLQGRNLEVDEPLVMPGDSCPACTRPLERIWTRTQLPPLTHLRDEGVLAGYEVGDEVVLRFTFDRMYEALTSSWVRRETEVLDDHEALEGTVRRLATPGSAAVLAAVRTACRELLREEPTRARALLLQLAGRPADPAVVSFLADLLQSWAQGRPEEAWSLVDELWSQAVGPARRPPLRDRADSWLRTHGGWAWSPARGALRLSAILLWPPDPGPRRLTAGLAAGLRFLGAAAAGDDPDRASRAASLLAEAAIDPQLTVPWHSEGHHQAVREAFRNSSPADLAFTELLVACHVACRRGRTDAVVVPVVLEILARLRGLGGLAAHAPRLRACTDWLLRLLALEVENKPLITSTGEALRDVVTSLPLLRRTPGRAGRLVRAPLLGLAARAIAALVGARLERLFASIPHRLTAGERPPPPPNLYTVLHLDSAGVEHWDRITAAFADPSAELTSEDLDTQAVVAIATFDQPGMGLLRAIAGSAPSHRGMRSVERGVELAEGLERRLAGQEGADGSLFNQLVWATLHARRHLDDALMGRLRALLEGMVERNRPYALSRYDASGQFLVNLCIVPVPDLFGPPGMGHTLALTRAWLAHSDWALVARLWDQLLFVGLREPRRLLRHLDALLVFEPDQLRIAGARVSPVPLDAVRDACRQDEARWLEVGFDLDEAPSGPVAVGHMLRTLATLELGAPDEVAAWLRRNQVPEAWWAVARPLAHHETLRKLRDEKAMTYFGNHLTLEFDFVRGVAKQAMDEVGRSARARGFRTPRARDVRRLMGALLDLVLRTVHDRPGGAAQPSRGPVHEAPRG